MHRFLKAGALGLGVLAAAAASAQQKPAELKIAMTTFLSGPAAVFGVPGRAAAEIAIDEINAAGGIGGVKIKPIILDEGVGGDKLLSEYRRVVQEEGVKVTLASISSGNCNALAPVAEDLKVLNVMWDCGTEKLLENRRFKYVVRSQGNATSEMVASVLQLLKVRPDFKTIAVINQDYAWGRDSWDIFGSTLKAMKPDVKVVAELFPKFGATDFSSEISRLQALAPDVILSTSWGGELDTLIRHTVAVMLAATVASSGGARWSSPSTNQACSPGRRVKRASAAPPVASSGTEACSRTASARPAKRTPPSTASTAGTSRA